MAERYGDVFRLPLPIWDLVVLNHPDFVEEILGDRDDRFSMGGSFGNTLTAFAMSLPGLERERHRVRRKALVPVFSRRNLARFADEIIDEMVARVDRWQEWVATGDYIDLQHAIAQVNLPTFLRTMYSTSYGDEELRQMDIDIRALMAASGSLGFGPTTLHRDWWKVPGAARRLINQANGLIRERAGQPLDDSKDLLSAVLAIKEDGKALRHPSKVAEILTLAAGGYDTVVASLSWTLGLLSLPENRDALEQLYREVDKLDGRAPSFEDISGMTWAKACFDEAQRLQGGPVHNRFAMMDVEIAGHHFPKGTSFGIGWYSMQTDPRWWPDPMRYDPSRFVDREIVKARPKHAFLPFGAGPHMCPGSGMGYLNAQLLLTIIMQRYYLETPPGWRPGHEFMLSTPVKGGLPVRLRSRI
ncbi:putative cytochrome P450 [Mycobacteroides abscessus subsp. abscessus]|nr:putative cytochrome P450 [Mycobacteroides abscessus subsp. abscessus]